ncbi:MAG: EAL domain-containing protein [Janthinobacterium lividum]
MSEAVAEAARTKRLLALEILDSHPEEIFDSLTQIAADICGVDMAMLNFIDRDRQWSKAMIGFSGMHEIPRELSICARTIAGNDILEIQDLHLDPVFKDNRLAGDDAMLRFYAGAPLVLADGSCVGTLCVVDRIPRKLTTHQLSALCRLASVVARALELREKAIAALAAMDLTQLQLQRLYTATPAMLQSTDRHGCFVTISDRWLAELGYDRGEILGRCFDELVVPGSSFGILDADWEDAGNAPIPVRMIRKDGGIIDVELSSVVDQNPDGMPLRIVTVIENVTVRDAARVALISSQKFLERTNAVAQIGGWEIDCATRRVVWSAEICRLHDREPGYTPTLAEVLACYVFEDRPIVENALQLCLETGRPWDLELRLVSATGRPFWGRVVGSLDVIDGKPVRMSGALQDVTARKLLERDLAESRELVQVTLNSINAALITTDLDARVTWMNPVAERMTGWSRDDADGRDLSDVLVIMDEFNARPNADPVRECLRLGQVVSLPDNVILMSRGGTQYSIKDSAAPIRDTAGHVLGAVVVFLDISEQSRRSIELEHRANHDALTGVANRSAFEMKLDDLLVQARADKSLSHVLLYIDLDQFKVVNDSCGHAAGDMLLLQITTFLNECVRDVDTVARLGGDEFCVILEGCSVDEGKQIAERIRIKVDRHRFQQESRRFRVGASIGLVQFDWRWADRMLIMQAADVACYAAKEAGRNRVHVWDETDRSTKLRFGDMKWVARLGQALDEDQFELYAQRIEALADTSGGVRCEVLLRLREPDGSLTLPGDFVAAAERFHMASRIDRRMTEKVIDWMENEPNLQERIDMISVNLSGQSIADKSFHHEFCGMIRRARFDVGKLCLEITETAAVTRFDDAKSFIDEVRGLGVKVALDDFGAGASSFGYLKTLPVDFLKIDGQFIKEITRDGLDAVAVKCFRDVARMIDVKTIAEFIERDDQRQALTALGIDFGQGYLLHRPEPLRDAVISAAYAETRQTCDT